MDQGRVVRQLKFNSHRSMLGQHLTCLQAKAFLAEIKNGCFGQRPLLCVMRKDASERHDLNAMAVAHAPFPEHFTIGIVPGNSPEPGASQRPPPVRHFRSE
jgi:hypothetical protein